MKDERLILAFTSQDEDGGGWIEDKDAEEWMSELVPLRAAIADGDLRSLYLGWLACVGTGALEDDEIEPPVPSGLGELTVSLASLADFLRIDDDLIAVAAEGSPPLQAGPSPEDLERWVRALPDAEKGDLLARVVNGEDSFVRNELRLRFREANALALEPSGGGRTVAELMARAEERAEARRRAEARERATARATYLDGLAGREEQIWHQVEELIDTKQPKKYDEAVRLLVDLRDLAIRGKTNDEFKARLSELRARHAKKSTFIERIDRTALRGK